MAKRKLVSEYDQFIVRMPPGMRDRISQAAGQNARSMNTEIVARLEQSFDPSLMSEEMAEQVEALHQCESALENTRDELAKANEIRELLGKYVEATERQNEALRKAGVAGEQIIYQLASAVSKAAAGDQMELERLVEQERERPILKRLTTVWSIVDED